MIVAFYGWMNVFFLVEVRNENVVDFWMIDVLILYGASPCFSYWFLLLITLHRFYVIIALKLTKTSRLSSVPSCIFAQCEERLTTGIRGKSVSWLSLVNLEGQMAGISLKLVNKRPLLLCTVAVMIDWLAIDTPHGKKPVGRSSGYQISFIRSNHTRNKIHTCLRVLQLLLLVLYSS
jgi:hypothetical protein